MSLRNIIALVLLVTSLLCLYPGITKPMMNLSVGTTMPLVGTIELYNKTQSILETIESLFASKNGLVAWMILIFSVLIPIAKALMLFTAIILKYTKKSQTSKKLQGFVNVIAKWSMADVFVVAIFMAFLAGKATPSITAVLHQGFWWFSAYCMLSMIAGQILNLGEKE